MKSFLYRCLKKSNRTDLRCYFFICSAVMLPMSLNCDPENFCRSVDVRFILLFYYVFFFFEEAFNKKKVENQIVLRLLFDLFLLLWLVLHPPAWR